MMMQDVRQTRIILTGATASGKGAVAHELAMRAGDLMVAPDGVPHGIRNSGAERLLVLAVLAPAP